MTNDIKPGDWILLSEATIDKQICIYEVVWIKKIIHTKLEMTVKIVFPFYFSEESFNIDPKIENILLLGNPAETKMLQLLYS